MTWPASGGGKATLVARTAGSPIEEVELKRFGYRLDPRMEDDSRVA